MDVQPHHPSPLGDLPVSFEAELLEQVGCAGVKVRTALRWALFDLLGIRLDDPTSSIADGGQRGPDSRSCDATSPVAASSEDAADPPVGQFAEALAYVFWLLMFGSSAGGPYWHQPTHSSPS